MARLPVVALAFGLFAATTVYSSSADNLSSALRCTVEITSDNLRLKAYLWMPNGPGPFPTVLFNHGSGGATPDQTAGMPITHAATRLATVFVRHGYASLFLFRRGQALSADQAPYLQEVLNREEASHGLEARQYLQFVLLKTEQLDDVMAALAFLGITPGIDSKRIAIVGHSFGGQLTLLAAERDKVVRAVVTFGAAANSGQTSPDLRALLLTAVANTNASVILIPAANDYDTAAGIALSSRCHDSRKSCVLKIYPAVGQTADDGHNAVYEAIPLWEPDVLNFLDANLKH